MCGRYYIATEEDIMEMREILEEIQRRYAGLTGANASATGEIFPTNTVPVLQPAEDSGRPEPVLMHWGFPGFRSGSVLINARSETASEKPTFRSAVAARRCVIPSTGFYEWTHDPGQKAKQKMLFRHPDRPVLYMAGLYGRFTRPLKASDPSPEPWDGFVILTTEANASVRAVHNRMPLVLGQEELAPWLYDRTAAERLLATPCRYLLEHRVV